MGIFLKISAVICFMIGVVTFLFTIFTSISVGKFEPDLLPFIPIGLFLLSLGRIFMKLSQRQSLTDRTISAVFLSLALALFTALIFFPFIAAIVKFPVEPLTLAAVMDWRYALPLIVMLASSLAGLGLLFHKPWSYKLTKILAIILTVVMLLLLLICVLASIKNSSYLAGLYFIILPPLSYAFFSIYAQLKERSAETS